MRTAALALFSLPLCSLAGDDDHVHQKPVVPPTVERGAEPSKTPASRYGVGREVLRRPGAAVDLGRRHRQEVLHPEDVRRAGRHRGEGEGHRRQPRPTLSQRQARRPATSCRTAPRADVTKLLKDTGNESSRRSRNDGGPAGFVLKLVTTGAKGATNTSSSDREFDPRPRRRILRASRRRRSPSTASSRGATCFRPRSCSPVEGAPNTFVTLPGFKVRSCHGPKPQLGSVGLSHRRRQGSAHRQRPGREGTRSPLTPGKARYGRGNERSSGSPRRSPLRRGCSGTGTRCTSCATATRQRAVSVTSSKNDDVLDKVEKLKAIQGGGRARPARVPPPGRTASRSTSSAATTPAAENFEHSRVPKNGSEDHLLPRQWDAAGTRGDPRAGRVRREDRPRRQVVGDLHDGLPQSLRLRVQRRRRDVRLRRGHGVGHGDAVVPPTR